MKRCLVLLIGATLSFSPGQTLGEKLDDDLAKLQGTWKLVSSENNGKVIKATNDVRALYEKDIKTDMCEGRFAAKSFIKLDSTKNPKRMEHTIIENVDKLAKGIKIPLIYELEGDRLRICVPPAGIFLTAAYPKDFATKGNNGQTVEIYERVKP